MRRTVGLIFAFFGLAIAIVVSMVFSFVEFRSLLAGDHHLFENPTLGGAAYLFRGLFFLSIVALCISIIVFIAMKKESFLPLFLYGTGIFIASLFSFAFYVWFIGLVIMVISFIPTITTFILMRRH